jgi:protein O-GlcNAc transferase
MSMADLTLEQAFDLAVRYCNAGKLNEAERLCRRIIAVQPRQADAIHLLGVIAHQNGQKESAMEWIRAAIAIRPEFAEAHFNLGNAMKESQRHDEAAASFKRAIEIKPEYVEALINLGNTLRDKGLHDEAIAVYQRAIKLRPDYAECHYNLGTILKESGLLEAAVAAFGQAITLKPDYFQAHNNLGEVFRERGESDRAIASYHQVLLLRPDHAGAQNNLGSALRDQGLLDEAVAAYRRAIRFNPKLAEAYNNLGNALKDGGQHDEALAAYRQAASLAPEVAMYGSNLIYMLEFHPAYDSRSIADEQQRWNRAHAEPLAKSISSHPDSSVPHRRLRIGYVSPDFRNHAQALFTVPVLSNHSHQEFEIYCYSSVKTPDPLTRKLKAYADCWREVRLLDHTALCDLIRADGIDILVDLTMHMAGSRLLAFARKPAPVQVTWLAYPGSTGLTSIDYRLSDPQLDPPGIDESVYSEKTIRLPDSFWCYDPLDSWHIAVNPLPVLETGRITFGCLNNFTKINEPQLETWARVLLQVPDSRLLLLAPIGSHRQRTLDRLSHLGIDPRRIEFVTQQPREKYLKTYHRIDIGLDTFPYNGHTTSLDSFWMGVPVVTLVGNRAVARGGWCQLSNLGLTELAGKTADEFVRIAVGLAGDVPRLAQLRSTLRQRMQQSPLMDGPRFTRNLESAYRRMWQRWCENLF